MFFARLVVRAAARTVLIATLCSLLPGARAAAQDTSSTPNLRPTPDSQLVVLRLRDGSSLVGRVVEVTPLVVRFASAAGESAIPRDAIREVRSMAATRVHDGEYWPEDPSRTRLFFAPTGRTLRQNESYFADAYVFFPSLQLGITDRVTIGGGASIIPGVPIDQQLFYLTPKVGLVASPVLNISVGALVAGLGAASSEGPFGIGYGVATFGGEDGNVTAGAGFGYARTSTSQALLMLGGSSRVSRNIALVTENYLYTGSGSKLLASGGFRFMGEKLAVDLAGFTWGDSSVPVLPYLAFIYRF